MKKRIAFLKSQLELLFFSTALILLFYMNVNTNETSFCVFKAVGIPYCLGCGIGHSIHYALHLKWVQSFEAHPFGIFGTLIILWRIFILITKNQNKHAPKSY